MAVLLVIQSINTGISLSQAVTTKAALNPSLTTSVAVKRDGQWQNIESSFLVPGDLVKLAADSVIPADCKVNKVEFYCMCVNQKFRDSKQKSETNKIDI